MVAQVQEIGIAVVAQTGQLVPADGLLYALRDVTATVDSLPLIASSIMSKKLAAGAQAIVLDVKTGSGAFMAKPADAFALARAMVDIGLDAGRDVEAIVTSMDQPLGSTVGNALEVEEAVDTLRGGGPADLRELCLVLGTRLLRLARGDVDAAAARAELDRVLDSGAALEKFQQFVVAQGGDGRVAESPRSVLPQPTLTRDVIAPMNGYIAAMDALTVGEAARASGAGRQRKGEPIDPAAGIRLLSKVGSEVTAGMPWACVYSSDGSRLDAGQRLMESALTISENAPDAIPLIYGSVDRDTLTARST
jgi:pyrimidine-nucleoside phosphorylase